MTESGDRTLCQFDDSGGARTLLLLDRLEQGFHSFGKVRNAVETDNCESALHLVQVGAAEPDLRQIAGVNESGGGELFQRLVGALQCEIDLALDPG